MLTVNTCFLPHSSNKNPRAYTSHTYTLTPPTEEILWIGLLSNLHSHSSLNFALHTMTFLKRPQSVTCVHRWTHRVSSSSKHPPDSNHLCFESSWHQVGSCWFFNICKSLQTAALGQIFTRGAKWSLCEWLHNYWTKYEGFNIFWKFDRMWAFMTVLLRV